MMKRREFFKRAGLSSAALAALPTLANPEAEVADQQDPAAQDEHDHRRDRDYEEPKGSLASATVAFGQWNADPVIDRFPNNSPRAANNHHLIPSEVTIKAGGAVTFVISGFHHVLIYGNRTRPADINLATTIFPTVLTGPAPGPPLIDDPVNRVYRGSDPSVFPMLPGSNPAQPLQDRLEVVRFPTPGRYLVMCGVLPHFFDAATGEFIMYGYVRVVR